MTFTAHQKRIVDIEELAKVCGFHSGAEDCSYQGAGKNGQMCVGDDCPLAKMATFGDLRRWDQRLYEEYQGCPRPDDLIPSRWLVVQHSAVVEY